MRSKRRLQLHVDLRERVLVGVASTDQTVVTDDHDDDEQQDDDGDDDADHEPHEVSFLIGTAATCGHAEPNGLPSRSPPFLMTPGGESSSE